MYAGLCPVFSPAKATDIKNPSVFRIIIGVGGLVELKLYFNPRESDVPLFREIFKWTYKSPKSYRDAYRDSIEQGPLSIMTEPSSVETKLSSEGDRADASPQKLIDTHQPLEAAKGKAFEAEWTVQSSLQVLGGFMLLFNTYFPYEFRLIVGGATSIRLACSRITTRQSSFPTAQTVKFLGSGPCNVSLFQTNTDNSVSVAFGLCIGWKII